MLLQLTSFWYCRFKHFTIIIVLEDCLFAGLFDKKKRQSLQIFDSSDESGLEDNQVCISFIWS